MSDAQYVIDIAAKMADGGQTVAQLDQLTAGLTEAGKNADFFSDAITKVGGELSAAKAQATAANDALSESNAEFSRLERAANQASIALEKAGKQAKGSVPIDVKRNADSARAALEAFKGTLAGVESEAAKAAAREKELTAQMANLRTMSDHVNKSIATGDRSMNKVQGALSTFGGGLGSAAASALGAQDAFENLSMAIGKSKAAAIVAASAVAALAVALVAGGIALASYGIGLADSARNMGLLSDAMKAQHPILASLDAATAGIARETGMHADELQKLAVKLDGAGVKAGEMEGALRAAALAETALGQGGAESFVASIKEGKTAVDDLAATTSAKFGGIVAQQMRGLTAQSKRLKDGLAATFGGLNIDPVLDGMARLVGLFDQETAAGQTLKFMFETVFQPLVNGVDGASVAVEAFVLRLMIWGLKGYIALKPFTAAFEALAVGIGVAASAFLLTLVPAALTALAALGPLIATAAVAAAPFLAIAAAAAAVYFAITNWGGLVAGVSAVFESIKTMGSDMIAGIVNSVLGGGPALISAMGGVVSGAIDSAKKMLGIASPSKVFEGIGANTVMGFTGALEDGQQDAAEAGGAMVSPAIGAAAQVASNTASAGGAVAAGVAAVSTPASAPAGGDRSVVINIAGVDGAESMISRIREEVTRLLEADGLASGATV